MVERLGGVDGDGIYESTLIHTSQSADTSILLENVCRASLREDDFLFQMSWRRGNRGVHRSFLRVLSNSQFLCR